MFILLCFVCVCMFLFLTFAWLMVVRTSWNPFPEELKNGDTTTILLIIPGIWFTWHMFTYAFLLLLVFFLPLLKKLNPTVGPPYLSYIIYLYILFSLKIFQFNTVLFYRFWVNTIWRLYTIWILYVRTIMSYLVSKSIK